MRPLPTGTVTMMFSDIEGSTALLYRLGEQYAEVLSGQRTLMRAAIAENDGHELGTEGDSFFVVFESAAESVRCCVAAQRSLSTFNWPEDVDVRVRMGVHSGEPTPHDGGYVGIDVHRAARIAAAAHGGQIVLSEPTVQLVEHQLPAGASMKDLGFHRLKDIEAPEHIYQLRADGLEERFPPLKSLGAETNLPLPMTPLVGRDREVQQLSDAVQTPDIRLVTLTGPGGVGKTRLALSVASSLGNVFRDGVYFVSLSGARDEGSMWSTIADTLNASSESSPAETVVAHVRDRQALLVLDNLEQIHSAPAIVATLLEAGARLALIATSRGPLHVVGEHELSVQPLEVPKETDLEVVAASSAVQLFLQQARMVRSTFAVNAENAADIAGICRAVDGLPLAVELAAARIRLLTPKALLANLGNRLELAAGDVGRPTRQQTLRRTIEWSYQLLSPETARAMRRMGVFVGGCDLEALAAVAIQDGADDALEVAQELLDVSLVTVGEGVDGAPRVFMLETIRDYALECLSQTGELEATRRLHAQHYSAVAQAADERLRGPNHLSALDLLELEHDNLRAAITWSLTHDEGAATALGLVEALAYFWYQHGYAAESSRWLAQALERAPSSANPQLGTISHWLGIMFDQLGERDDALVYLERSLEIARQLEDRDQQARELNSLGSVQLRRGDLALARANLEESVAIARSLGRSYRLAAALTNLGHVESQAGNYSRSLEILEEALSIDEASGDTLGVALDQQSIAATNLRLGQAQRANHWLSLLLDYLARSGNLEFLFTTLEIAACIAVDLGEALRAAVLTGAAEALRLKTSMPIDATSAAELKSYLARARATVSSIDWETAMDSGRHLSQEGMFEVLTAQDWQPSAS